MPTTATTEKIDKKPIKVKSLPKASTGRAARAAAAYVRAAPRPPVARGGR